MCHVDASNTMPLYRQCHKDLSSNARRHRWPEPIVLHSARTAVAALVSVAAARLVRLPEAYWAPVTTVAITQSTLGAALAVSRGTEVLEYLFSINSGS